MRWFLNVFSNERRSLLNVFDNQPRKRASVRNVLGARRALRRTPGASLLNAINNEGSFSGGHHARPRGNDRKSQRTPCVRARPRPFESIMTPATLLSPARVSASSMAAEVTLAARAISANTASSVPAPPTPSARSTP